MLSFLWSLPSLTVGLLIAIIFVYRLKTWRVTRLIDQLPGPEPYFLLGNAWTFVGTKREDNFAIGQNLMMPYAKFPVNRTWLAFVPQITITKAFAIEVLLGSNKLIEKADFYRYMHSWLGSGLLTSTGDKWRSHRKLITQSFHFRILEDFLSIFNEQADILVNILQQFEGKGQFDIYPYMTRCTLDVIAETAMGVQTIKAQINADSEYVKAVNTAAEIISLRMISPWLFPDILFKLSSHGRTYAKSLRILHDFTKKVIKERQAEYSEGKKLKVEEKDKEEDVYGRKRRLAFLDLLLESTCEGRKLNESEISEEVDTFMFEGHDTTAAASIWILYNIGRFPKIQTQVHRELDDVFGNSDRPITSEDLHKMKFLECVIKESLRLFPPVPFYGRKLTEDVKIGEYLLPAGVDVLIPVHRVHHDPEHFPDPEKFDPDRFLPENAAGRHPYSYIPFSAGPRNCIGQKFAMMEEKVIVSKVLRSFRITSMHKVEDLKLLAELVFRPFNGMWVRLERRQENLL